MKNISPPDFINSLKGFDDFDHIIKIIWFVFYKLYIEKVNYVKKEDIRPLFSQCWIDEPQNFNQLWFYLIAKKKILIKQKDGFVLARKVYQDYQILYSSLLPQSKTKKRLKKLSKGNIVIIPTTVLKLLTKDLVQHCNELNENLEAENWISSMLLMRKTLPLAIIRKFQKDNKEKNIKYSNGEYLNSEKLLEKSQNLVEPRIYKEIKEIKFLYDSIQHIFNFFPGRTDISPATIRLRVFLEDLFKRK